MTRKSLLAITLATLTLVPLSCTVETTKNDGTGGAENGGTTHAAGAPGTGGANATGGVATNGGTTTGVAGSTGVAGTPAATGGTSSTQTAAATGGSTVVGTAGGGGIAQTSTTGGVGTAGTTGTIVQTRLDVTSSIVAAATWTADHVYVIPSGHTLYVSATLTIQPGTVVKFGPGARLYIEQEGQLNAVGTGAANIVFTAIKDDTAGGDTNGDGSASQAAMGDWSEITVQGNSSSFDFVQVRYAALGINLDGSGQSVKHSTFTANKVGVDATGISSPTSTVITDNVLYGNERPIVTDANVAINATNVFNNPSVATQRNTFQAIEIVGSIDTSVTWSNTSVAYALKASGSTYYVQDPATLTLAAGVVVKLGTSSTLYVETGASINGLTTATFTSYRDDSLLGDSNGDGTATAPAVGDWDGVRDASDWFSGANILYSTN